MTPEQNVAIARWIGFSVGSLGFLNTHSKKEVFRLWYKGRPAGRKDFALNAEEAFKTLAPDFTKDTAGFVELLRVCAAKFHAPRLTDVSKVVDNREPKWEAELWIFAGLHNTATQVFRAEAPTECEALALAVLKLIESENTK